MKQNALPTYAELNAVLKKTKLKLHPSQVHGLICGILCGKAESTAAWETLVTGGGESEKVHGVLQNLYKESAVQLKDFLFELQLVLPTDKVELSERAEALTLWCQGMLTGLKITEVQIVDREPSEVTEAINDFIEIAKMNYEEVVSSEEDEEAYAELVEYVRMAVILVYESLHEGDVPVRAEGSDNLLH
jgi:uncharacterized protein